MYSVLRHYMKFVYVEHVTSNGREQNEFYFHKFLL